MDPCLRFSYQRRSPAFFCVGFTASLRGRQALTMEGAGRHGSSSVPVLAFSCSQPSHSALWAHGTADPPSLDYGQKSVPADNCSDRAGFAKSVVQTYMTPLYREG